MRDKLLLEQSGRVDEIKTVLVSNVKDTVNEIRISSAQAGAAVSVVENGAPGEIRTPDLLIRRADLSSPIFLFFSQVIFLIVEEPTRCKSGHGGN